MPACRTNSALYDESPEYMAALLARIRRSRARQHRRRLLRHDAGPYPRDRRGGARQGAAHSRPSAPRALRLSGLEPFTLTPDIPFVNVGERTNVTGSARFRKLVTAGDYTGGARRRARPGRERRPGHRRQHGRGPARFREAMTTFLNLVAAEPDIARVPVMVDSSKFKVIEAGLKCIQGKAIVNSISLKEGEDEFIRQARSCAAMAPPSW